MQTNQTSPKDRKKDDSRAGIWADDQPRRPKVVFYSFIVTLVIVLVLNFLVFRHFLVVVMVAGSIAAMLGPLYDRLTRALGGRRSIAAALMVAMTTVVILVPLTSYGVILANQAVDLFEAIRPRLEPEALQSLWNEALPAQFPWLLRLQEWLQLGEPEPSINAMEFVGPAFSRIASGANRLVQGMVAGLTSAFLDLIIFLITLFFILRDGLKLRDELQSIAPVSPQRAKEVYVQLAKTVKGVLYAMVVVPVSQGILAMIGFALFGLPSPLFWGTMLIFGAMIPGIGSPLVWVPCGIYLLLTAEPWQGLGLLIYGTLIISTSDNIIKPILLRETAQIHPLLAFFAILGGILSFGAVGFLVGPVILSLMLSVVRIYRTDVLRSSEASTESVVASSSGS